MSKNKFLQKAVILFFLVLLITACSGSPGSATPAAHESVDTLVPPTLTPTQTLTPTSTPMPPTSTPTLTAIGSPIEVGKWESTIVFNVGEAVNVVNFSFTVSENGEQIEGFGILDLGLGQITTGTTSVAIIDGTFAMSADSYSGTTRIGRTFEGAFVASDKVEGTFVFDYGPGRLYEGEWTGTPESQD